MDAAERARNLERVRPWVAACAAFLHLDHWTVTVGDEPAEDGALARVIAPLLPPPFTPPGETKEGNPMAGSKAFMCGIVSMSGPNGEPLACAYPPGHNGDHSWATLPTFVSGGKAVGLGAIDVLHLPEVRELIEAAIESTDDTPRTARLRQALEAFGVR